jgi:hypothetical protein
MKNYYFVSLLFIAIASCKTDNQAEIKIETEDSSVVIGESGIQVSDADSEVDISWDGITAGDSKKVGQTHKFEGVGLEKTVSLNNENINVEGVGNTVYATGRADRISIEGIRNRVYVDQVTNIEMEGLGNRIYYKSNMDGATPTVRKDGLGNKVKMEDWKN